MERALHTDAVGLKHLRRLRALLLVVVLTSLAAGAAKLVVQRQHAPRWGTKARNRFGDWIAIDGHATRAAQFRAWFLGQDPGAEDLREGLREHHSTAVLIPALVALGSLATGSIPFAYALFAGLAWWLQLALVMRLAARIDTRGDPATGRIAGILFAAHGLSARTLFQLLLDPFVALFTILALVVSLAWVDGRRPAAAGGLLLTLALGTFTKLSFLPVLALPVVVLLVAQTPRLTSSGARSPGRPQALVVAVVLGALAVLPLALYVAWFVGADSSVADMRQFATTWSLAPERLRQFGIEMLLLVQAAPLLFLLRPQAPGPGARAVLAVMALVLLPLLAFGFPAVPRLYLPVLGPGAALCAGRLAEWVPARLRVRLLLVYGVLNLAVACLGLYLQSSSGA